MNKKIELLAGRTQKDVLDHQCDYVQEFDSIKEAKRKLEFVPNGGGQKERYLFSQSYQNIVEASEPLRYAQILVNGECLYDYFAKGYTGEDPKPDNKTIQNEQMIKTLSEAVRTASDNGHSEWRELEKAAQLLEKMRQASDHSPELSNKELKTLHHVVRMAAGADISYHVNVHKALAARETLISEQISLRMHSTADQVTRNQQQSQPERGLRREKGIERGGLKR